MIKEKYLYINTIGCQMNVDESRQMASGLNILGYKKTDVIEQADLIIANTCAIRAKAEQKVYSFLGRLDILKKRNPELIIGVGGCVAQQEGAKILRRIPGIDFVFGTHAVFRLPEIVRRVEQKRCRIIDIEMKGRSQNATAARSLESSEAVSAFVTIMQGCDNFCSYCVVPYVRGREESRPPEKIIQEIKWMVGRGVREITLLGQNVNSYGQKEGLFTFCGLLKRIHAIDGLKKIRFTTSHPKDFSPALMTAYRNLDKLCKHIHLPVQSGSNRILERMNRKYSREVYLEKIDSLRHICPEMAITSDIIVGFPGESDDDFKQTLDLIKKVEFDGLFVFKYSDRPNARAAGFPKKISEKEKQRRLSQVLALQAVYTKQKNQALVGSVQAILVEGLSKKESQRISATHHSSTEWTGRTSGNKVVNFIFPAHAGSEGPVYDLPKLAGTIMDIKITDAFSNSLWGVPLQVTPRHVMLKGEKSYAA
jgi:tRNA-2-methylthio-N6-dimethylallyladenosine synthase